MEKSKKIVVAVDESEESMYALSWCLTNLFTEKNINDTLLVLLYVKPPPPVYSSIDAPGYLFAGDALEIMEKHTRNLANSVMNRAETVFRDFRADVYKSGEESREWGTGDAKEVICVAVEKLRADILVMGSHDYGFLKRTLLGSMSDHCSKTIKCPMVVVKRPKDIMCSN